MRFWLGGLLALASCASRAPVRDAPDVPAADGEAVPGSKVGDVNEVLAQRIGGLRVLYPMAAVGVESPELAALLLEHWNLRNQRWPILATQMGNHRFDRILERTDLASIEARQEEDRGLLERARGIDPTQLTESDQLTLELLATSLEEGQREAVCRFHEWSVTPRDTLVGTLQYLPELHPGVTREDRANLRARMAEVPRLLAEHQDNLRIGLAAGRVANAQSLERVLEQLQVQVDQPTPEWPGVAAAVDLGDELHHEALVELVDQELRPAFEELRRFMAEELLPQARREGPPGLTSLDLGAACYPELVASFTTLPLSPEEVHQLGLDELVAIHAEMREVSQQVFGHQDLERAFATLREDPALRFSTEDEVEAAAVDALARAQAAVPAVFGRLPQTGCEVARIPAYEAPYTSIAYYRPPHPDGSKPGEYFVNTFEPETRPRFEAQALAFHEAVPGHHFQIALSQEQHALPLFRRHLGMTAYVEGWALYSERLADELGLYTTPLDRFGMLSFDSWRAARLVVDTGLHHEGWTRQQAVDFMLGNTPLAANNIYGEVDRYITWPGQALGYKVGQVELRRLRAEAEAALGEDFVLADFHDLVLGSGAVTLPVLRGRVETWVAAELTAPLEEAPDP